MPGTNIFISLVKQLKKRLKLFCKGIYFPFENVDPRGDIDWFFSKVRLEPEIVNERNILDLLSWGIFPFLHRKKMSYVSLTSQLYSFRVEIVTECSSWILGFCRRYISLYHSLPCLVSFWLKTFHFWTCLLKPTQLNRTWFFEIKLRIVCEDRSCGAFLVFSVIYDRYL